MDSKASGMLAAATGKPSCAICRKVFRDTWALRRHENKKRACFPPKGHDEAVAEKLHQMQSQIDELKSRPPIITNFTGDVHIHINRFGLEDTDHITTKMVKDWIWRATSGAVVDNNAAAKTVVQSVMNAIYSDPTRPENTTVYMANRREGRIMTYCGQAEGWRPTTLSAVMPEMKHKVLGTLDDRRPYDDDVAPPLGSVPFKEACRIVDVNMKRVGDVLVPSLRMDDGTFSKLTQEVLGVNKYLARASNAADETPPT